MDIKAVTSLNSIHQLHTGTTCGSTDEITLITVVVVQLTPQLPTTTAVQLEPA